MSGRRRLWCRRHRGHTVHQQNGGAWVCVACARRSAEYAALYDFLVPFEGPRHPSPFDARERAAGAEVEDRTA